MEYLISTELGEIHHTTLSKTQAVHGCSPTH